MVCRMTKSFLRFGSFQLPSTRPEDLPLVKQLADYAIAEHFSDLEGTGTPPVIQNTHISSL